jgi:tetratricopeptide (TPR) repeat protein
MAEALLTAGDWDDAETEATRALELYPHSKEAKSIFKRTRWQPLLQSKTLDALTAHCQNLIRSGKALKAEKFLIRQIRETSEPCPDCHRALAVLYETSERYSDAIAEWQIFRREAPEQAAREGIALRLEGLQPKSLAQSKTK